ncbi:hypothetical protein WMF31_22745 [Sorangium sp. So ce1036]|uniref:hypothetical protein n=1 Tax=Sorangium sp. So ce1036 TaxID=3133328 RepID=UPI003F0C6E95
MGRALAPHLCDTSSRCDPASFIYAPDQGGQVPAAALTAYASQIDRSKVLAAGFQMHLCKPVDPGALATAVLELAESQERRHPR